MKPFINRNAINKTQFRSAGVSVLSYTAHQIRKEGVYKGKIFQKSDLVDEFYIHCTEKSDNKQVNVNLSELKGLKASEMGQKSFDLAKEGYLLLFDSQQNEDYHISLEANLAEKKGEREFDTKALEKGDLYTITLIRPGEYQGLNTRNKAEFQAIVVYPDLNPEKQEKATSSPIRIEVKEDGFHPNKVKIAPGQGLIFNIQTKSNIQIDLKKGYDKKPVPQKGSLKGNRPKKSSQQIRWVNPKKSKND